MMNGSIEVSSEENKGSTFQFAIKLGIANAQELEKKRSIQKICPPHFKRKFFLFYWLTITE
ncbi:MAG: hypothetical protein ACI84K_000914 [Pseudohongiellaceae bacterium]|jgi:hypothetical protein